MKNNHVEVKKHYLQAVRSKPYDDDNESSLHIISHAKMSLKKIIALDVERARTSGIAHLNMFAEQATVSLMGNVQLPSEEQEHRLTSRL